MPTNLAVWAIDFIGIPILLLVGPFDGTISMGNVLTAAAFLVMAGIQWSALQNRIKDLEEARKEEPEWRAGITRALQDMHETMHMLEIQVKENQRKLRRER